MIFADSVAIFLSSRADGSMATGQGKPQTPQQLANVENFLSRSGLSSRRSAMQVTYAPGRSYTDIERIDASNAGVPVYADAIYTTDSNQVLVLPVADCVATVIYDPVTNLLGLLHLGRHSSVAGLIEAFVIDVADALGSDPRNWRVWMSPSLSVQNDKLAFFDPVNSQQWQGFVHQKNDGFYIDTAGHNRARFERAGVATGNITMPSSDTYADEKYFSHRAFLDGQLDKNGRMIVAAQLSVD